MQVIDRRVPFMNPFKTHALLEECPPRSDDSQVVRLTQVYLELTPHCNNYCAGCPNESFIDNFAHRSLHPKFKISALDQEQWRKILFRFPESIESVILSGGEPTLHPNFLDILKEIEQDELRYAIFTNGRWSNSSQIFQSLLHSRYFSGFLISLHGATPTSHDAFSEVPGSFYETIKNIQKSTQLGFPVSLSIVITQQNICELTEIPKLAMDLGVNKITFNRYNYSPDRLHQVGFPITPPSILELRSGIQKIETMRLKYDGQIQIGYGPTIPQCFEQSASRVCSAGDSAITIDPWGNVKPCLHTNLLCGNLLQQDFDSIWDGDALNMWRNMIDESCNTCSLVSQCGGGCRAMSIAWGINRDPLNLDTIYTESIV